MKAITFWYLAGYLLFGGFGLAFFPQETLRLFQSSGDYGDIMPRVAGMFMVLLGGVIASMSARRDFTYYARSVQLRLFALGFLVFLFERSGDPLFMVLLAIVLIGWLPSAAAVLRERARCGAQGERA